MTRPLRLGLLGTGVAARQLYLPAFRALSRRVQVVACASRGRASAEAFAALAGIPRVVDTAEELIHLPEVDALFLSLPIDAQPRYVLAALHAGKPVLSEKPVGPSVAVARKLIARAERLAVPWLVGENYAYAPTLHRLLDWLARGRLGALRVASVRQLNRMGPQNPYFHTAWRVAPGHVGGYLTDGGVHVAHWLRRCCGEPRRVRATTAAFEADKPPLDTAVATIELDSGVLATWTSCFAAPYSGPALELFGSEGSARLGMNEAVLESSRGKLTTFRSERSTFELELAHFAEVVLRGATPLVTPESALADLALVEAIVKAR